MKSCVSDTKYSLPFGNPQSNDITTRTTVAKSNEVVTDIIDYCVLVRPLKHETIGIKNIVIHLALFKEELGHDC